MKSSCELLRIPHIRDLVLMACVGEPTNTTAAVTTAIIHLCPLKPPHRVIITRSLLRLKGILTSTERYHVP